MNNDEPRFTSGEALAATGASEAWLRTLIQRDKGGVIGTKDRRTRRLLFTRRDLGKMAIMYDLNAGMKVSPTGVWEIMAALNDFLDTYEHEEEFWSMSFHVGFAENGDLFCWHIDEDGVQNTWNVEEDEGLFPAFQAMRRPHISIPMHRYWAVMAKASEMERVNALETDA